MINSDKNYKGEIKVHIDQLKPFVIPETSKWVVNVRYLMMSGALETLGLRADPHRDVVLTFFLIIGDPGIFSKFFASMLFFAHSCTSERA